MIEPMAFSDFMVEESPCSSELFAREVIPRTPTAVGAEDGRARGTL